MKKEGDQNILGHTTCDKCGEVHWMYAKCPSSKASPTALGQAGAISVMEKALKDLRAENNSLKEQLEKLTHPMQVLPAGVEIEVRSIPDEEVWLRVFCSAMPHSDCDVWAAESAANAGLRIFNDKFRRGRESE